MSMEKEDLEFMAEIVERSHWLLYGDLEENFSTFIKKVFEHDFKEYGFGDIKMEPDFAVAYWLLISELTSLNLYEYGTSPRGGWLTEQGIRFKKIILENEDAISETEQFIMKKYN